MPRTCGSALNSALRFVLEPPVPVPVGIAGLGHEAVDHAMEDDAVVEAFAHQLLDARDVAGREVGPQLDDDLPCVVSMTSVFSGSL